MSCVVHRDVENELLNTLWTGDADLGFYFTNVQGG